MAVAALPLVPQLLQRLQRLVPTQALPALIVGWHWAERCPAALQLQLEPARALATHPRTCKMDSQHRHQETAMAMINHACST